MKVCDTMLVCCRFVIILCFSLSSFIWRSHQLQSSQTQVLLQLRKHLEYPKQLDSWVSTGIGDLCYVSSPQVNITCQDNVVTEIRIFGDKQTKPTDFNGFPIPYRTLSQNFSMDSLVATLSRLNNLRVLTLASVGIWGPIPDKIHRLQSVEYLDLSWNFLYGSIPQTISRIGNLQYCKLDGNFLNGAFPDSFDSFSNLSSLSVSYNRLGGPLPSSLLKKTTSLVHMNLSNNGISGKLPDLSRLSHLRWLDLSNNRLNSELVGMPKGIIVVMLRNNSFSGRIPEKYGQLNQLQQLDLSYNDLQGTPPAQIFALPNVNSINLGSNKLSGSIPIGLVCGQKLGSVDLSNNSFRGLLPPCMSSSSNGRTTKSGGNCLLNDLNDQHPESYCLERSQENTKSHHVKNVGVVIGTITGVAIVLGLLAFAFLVSCRHYCVGGTSEKHLLQNSMHDKSVTGEILTNTRYISDAPKYSSQCPIAHRIFILDELTAATNTFDKSNLMGEGSAGKIYKGRLETGARVAIRCLTVSKKYTMRNLKLRLDLLARLRHPHLVCLLGHCIETEEKDGSGANKVYLVYEYVGNDNYRAHLSETNPEKVLKWSNRLAILIGVAKAVHFMHTGVIPGFFNNRLRSNNVLLNEHCVGKLSDYGLSVVAQDIDIEKEENGLESWQMKSLEDDIYSFGLILLESLVGPSVCERKDSFLLNEIVTLGNPDGQRRIIDQTVLSSCSEESLSTVVSLTINCFSSETSARPSFEDVLWNLQYAAQVQVAK